MLSEKGMLGGTQERGRNSEKEGWRCQENEEGERGLVRGKAITSALGLVAPQVVPWREQGTPAIPSLHLIQGFPLSRGPGTVCLIPAHLKVLSQRAASAAWCCRLLLPQQGGRGGCLEMPGTAPGSRGCLSRLRSCDFGSCDFGSCFLSPPVSCPITWSILWVRNLSDKF